jgi:aspartate/methionine/tyrosine aminotransferase
MSAAVSHLERRFEAGYAIEMDAVRAALRPNTRLIVLSNLHNPTCARIPASTMQELAELAEERNLHLLVDEVYLEWLYDVPPAERAAAAATFSPRIITTSSVTKVFGLSALHLGWIVATPVLAKRLHHASKLMGMVPGHLSERIAHYAIEHPEIFVTPWREKTAENRAVVKAWVERTPHACWVEPSLGTTVFVELGRGDTRELADRLMHEYDTAVVPGHHFGAPTGIRIGVGVETEMLVEGLQRLGTLLETIPPV